MVDIPSFLRVGDFVSTARLFLNHIGMLGIESVQVRPLVFVYKLMHSDIPKLLLTKASVCVYG